jgi:hypothetical protein
VKRCNISTAKEKVEEDRGGKKGAREEPHRAQRRSQQEQGSKPSKQWKWKAFLLAFAPAAFVDEIESTHPAPPPQLASSCRVTGRQ